MTDLVNQHFPKPGSNRGFSAATFVNGLIMMLHEGGTCLEDLRHLRSDKALRKLVGLKQVPTAGALGDWLRRLGDEGVKALTEVNRQVLALSLHRCKTVTLDIDATLSASQHRTAEWTYKKCTGYMPMVGHIAETGQVVATDFRAGNVAPAAENLEFIKQCEGALPEGTSVKYLRIDAAGYQCAILDDCVAREIEFAVRAKMSSALRQLIEQAKDWQPLLNRKGEPIEGQMTTRVVHAMSKSQHAFNVVIQRKLIKGQQCLLVEEEDTEGTSTESWVQEGYLYRAIATNRTALNNSELIHWYNQRGEHSENRIKELKEDFGAGRMPCGQISANALYFSLCALAYNLFALMRAILPARFESVRAKTLRWRLYGLAGKVVIHARQVCLKVQKSHHALLAEVLSRLQQALPGPSP